MKTVIYQYRCSRTKLEFRCKIENVSTITEEPYPPGGFLRVCRDFENKLLCGPLVSEITSWKEIDQPLKESK